MQGVEVPVWAGFAGLDVVRGADGEFNVLEDNVRMPTGLGFAPLAWEARRRPARRRAARAHARRAGEPRSASPRSCARSAPDGRGDPSIVVLGDGFENDAQWEISDVAFRLGVPMVGLDDLRQREGRVYAHVDGRRREVDVIYRRSNYHLLRDEDGSPSALADKLLEPIRRGTVTVVNPPGVGIADDKLAHAYVEDMIRFYLSEEPVIAPARSYDLDRRRRARGRARPARRDGRQGPRPRRRRGRADRPGGRGRARGHRGAARRTSSPRSWSSSRATRRCSTASSSPRRIDLRPLIAYDGGEQATVLGGLTRVALGEDSKVVNMAQGGGVKATWTVGGERGARRSSTAARAVASNRAVRRRRGAAAAKAATRAEPVLRERYDRWSGAPRQPRAARSSSRARSAGATREDTIIAGEPHHVVWKDGMPVEAFPPVADLELRPELRDFDERLAEGPAAGARAPAAL